VVGSVRREDLSSWCSCSCLFRCFLDFFFFLGPCRFPEEAEVVVVAEEVEVVEVVAEEELVEVVAEESSSLEGRGLLWLEYRTDLSLELLLALFWSSSEC